MHFCIFNLSCYALLKANVYIFQSCTWLLTLFPTFCFSTQNQEFQRVLLVVLLYCSIFKISFTVVFDSFYILSHLFVFVKPFFQIFSNSFSRLVFRLDVTFIYCITFLSVCQALFQDFFQPFLLGFSHGSRDSLFILPLSFSFVNRFESSLYICISKASQATTFYSKIYIFRHCWGIKKSLRSFPADRRATALFNVPASKKAYI